MRPGGGGVLRDIDGGVNGATRPDFGLGEFLSDEQSIILSERIGIGSQNKECLI